MKVTVTDENGNTKEYTNFVLHALDEGGMAQILQNVSLQDLCFMKERISYVIGKQIAACDNGEEE